VQQICALGPTAGLRHLKFEQRDCDRKHTVAERFDLSSVALDAGESPESVPGSSLPHRRRLGCPSRALPAIADSSARFAAEDPMRVAEIGKDQQQGHDQPALTKACVGGDDAACHKVS
jgi:hypothetical protein